MAGEILLVDGEVSVLMTLKAVLELEGHTVDTVSSPAEAKKLLATKKYDLVVTEFLFGEKRSGNLVVNAVKTLQGTTPVVILTAFPQEAADWRTLGASLLLQKPMHTQTLKMHLNSFIRSETTGTMREQYKRGAKSALSSEFFLPLERLTLSGKLALGLFAMLALLILLRVPVQSHYRGFTTAEDIWLWEDSRGTTQFGNIVLRELFLCAAGAIVVIFVPKRYLLRGNPERRRET